MRIIDIEFPTAEESRLLSRLFPFPSVDDKILDDIHRIRNAILIASHKKDTKCEIRVQSKDLDYYLRVLGYDVTTITYADTPETGYKISWQEHKSPLW